MECEHEWEEESTGIFCGLCGAFIPYNTTIVLSEEEADELLEMLEYLK